MNKLFVQSKNLVMYQLRDRRSYQSKNLVMYQLRDRRSYQSKNLVMYQLRDIHFPTANVPQFNKFNSINIFSRSLFKGQIMSVTAQLLWYTAKFFKCYQSQMLVCLSCTDVLHQAILSSASGDTFFCIRRYFLLHQAIFKGILSCHTNCMVFISTVEVLVWSKQTERYHDFQGISLFIFIVIINIYKPYHNTAYGK